MDALTYQPDPIHHANALIDVADLLTSEGCGEEALAKLAEAEAILDRLEDAAAVREP